LVSLQYQKLRALRDLGGEKRALSSEFIRILRRVPWLMTILLAVTNVKKIIGVFSGYIQKIAVLVVESIPLVFVNLFLDYVDMPA
jgi:Mg/Co/Ni transporter MgtE